MMTILKRLKFSRTRLQSMTHTKLKEICKRVKETLQQSYENTYYEPAVGKVQHAQKFKLLCQVQQLYHKQDYIKLKIKNLRSGTLGRWPRGIVGPRGFKNR